MSQNIKSNKANINAIKVDKAMAIAQGIKQENQTKAQTKLVAQGIRKGIELYKKQQNKKTRDVDKRKKKEIKEKLSSQNEIEDKNNRQDKGSINFSLLIPWILLISSWIFFVIYCFILK